MILFHGSEFLIEKPRFGEGAIHNDYGQGFYCTTEKSLAGEWAVTSERDGIINQYELNLSNLSVLDLTDSDYHVLNWLSILLENRVFDVRSSTIETGKSYLIKEYGIDYRSYDVIKGWRADDSYFSFARAFLNNGLSVPSLEKAMRLGNLGIQYVLISKRAFRSIHFVDWSPALRSDSLQSKTQRIYETSNHFADIRDKQDLQGPFLIDLLRENK